MVRETTMIPVGVTDVERSVEFYRDGLGLQHIPHDDGSHSIETHHSTLRLFSQDESLEEMDEQLPSPEEMALSGMTLTHNVPLRDEVDQILQDAEAAGGCIIKAPEETSWGGYAGYFADPDGIIWEIAWNPVFWAE